MKRRLTPFLIGMSVILIGTLAYAADRRKNTKRVNQPVNDTHEEEALRAELLDAVEGYTKKSPDAASADKTAINRSDVRTYQIKPSK